MMNLFLHVLVKRENEGRKSEKVRDRSGRRVKCHAVHSDATIHTYSKCIHTWPDDRHAPCPSRKIDYYQSAHLKSTFVVWEYPFPA